MLSLGNRNKVKSLQEITLKTKKNSQNVCFDGLGTIPGPRQTSPLLTLVFFSGCEGPDRYWAPGPTKSQTGTELGTQ